MAGILNGLLKLSPTGFSSIVKNLSNDKYKEVLNAANQQSKGQELLRQFGNTTNALLKTRKNNLVAFIQQAEAAKRRARNTRRLTAPSSPQILGTGAPTGRTFNDKERRLRTPRNVVAPPPPPPPPAQRLGTGNVITNQKRLNELRKAEDARRKQGVAAQPPRVPTLVAKLPRKTEIVTLANLAEREGKKIFVNVSYVPENGIRNFTNKLEGMSSVEKKECPVLVKQDPSKGYVLSVMTGESTSLVLPMPVPEIVGGKIVTVAKDVAQPILNEEKEPKKVSIQHSFLKDNKGLYSISYEATLYKDQKNKPFFYYLNQQELKENGNDGIPMYDVPGVPAEFLLNQ